MATQTQVNTARQALDDLWANPPARDNRFGNVLKSVAIRNIRGLSLTLEFRWPLTAIGGVNGSGKTTILQVCSAGYTRHGSGKRGYTLGRWIGPALAGESPAVTPTAEVTYAFWDTTPSVVVPYQLERTRWGYPRRGNPERNVRFVGITDFAPRIERLDRTHQNRARLNVLQTAQLDPRIVESVAGILGSPYDDAALHTVTTPAAQWTDVIPELTRDGSRYTESHMGAGEQKAVRLVQSLEELPERSLVLLEEPELTLHPDAQFGLAWYLMTLARRRGHQIIIATHSPHIFEALPTEARVLVVRDAAGTTVLHAVSQLSAARQLSHSVRTNRDLVFVEDAVAVRFVTEIFRRFAPDLLKGANIIALGNAADVQRMVARLRSQQVRAVGVRDPDQGQAADQGLFSLPGDVALEQLLLEHANVERAERLLAGIGQAAQRAAAHGQGYEGSAAAKRVFAALCTEMEMPAEFIADRLTLAWMDHPDWAGAAQQLAVALHGGLDV